VDGTADPTPGQRRVNDVAVVVAARHGFETAHFALSGTDMYGLTAEIVALGISRLLLAPPAAVGVVAPAQALPAADMLAELDLRCESSFDLPAALKMRRAQGK
jgi:hypothetical protein